VEKIETKDVAQISNNVLDDFLTKHREEIEELPNGKILCKITNHELPKRLNLLQAHWQGKAFHRAMLKKAKEPIKMEDYAGVLKKHKVSNTQVYCGLTRRSLPNDKTAVQKHLQGRRYKNALAKKSKKKLNEEAKEKEVEDEDGDEFEGDSENEFEQLQEELINVHDYTENNKDNKNETNNNPKNNMNDNTNNDTTSGQKRKRKKKKRRHIG